MDVANLLWSFARLGWCHAEHMLQSQGCPLWPLWPLWLLEALNNQGGINKEGQWVSVGFEPLDCFTIKRCSWLTHVVWDVHDRCSMLASHICWSQGTAPKNTKGDACLSHLGTVQTASWCSISTTPKFQCWIPIIITCTLDCCLFLPSLRQSIVINNSRPSMNQYQSSYYFWHCNSGHIRFIFSWANHPDLWLSADITKPSRSSLVCQVGLPSRPGLLGHRMGTRGRTPPGGSSCVDGDGSWGYRSNMIKPVQVQHQARQVLIKLS